MGAGGRIYLWWVGERAVEPTMELARTQLAKVYGREVALGLRPGRPADAYDPRRRQVSSSRLLGWLLEGAPEDAERLVGVTDEDLFIPVLTFVFGEAQLEGRAAVVSTARLSPQPGAPGGAGLLGARLSKECVHELGHTYGLLHCERAQCAMSRSASVFAVDVKAPVLCGDCRARLNEFRHRGG